jgi:hypothetical protein
MANFDEVLAQALALSHDERLALAERLLESARTPAADWDSELASELDGIESGAAEPPAGLQPRRVILTSQNGSSMSFLRRPGKTER